MASIVDFCTFCDQDDLKIYHRAKNFTVWLALGQITEGYSLIIPNDHYNCIGSIPTDLQKEYLELKDLVREKLTQEYGDVIFYEHGRAGYCNVQPGEQLCYHGHTHAVPLNVDLVEPMIEEGLYPIKLENPEDIFKKYYELGHYLYFENSDREAYMFQINQPIPRQYLRKLTSNAIGRPELADWDKYPEIEVLNAAKKKLTPMFLKIKEA